MFDRSGHALLSAYQVAGLRIFSASLVMLPFALRAWRRIPASSRGTIVLAGLMGNFFPAFLFCVAETKIDSALAASVNSLTPIFAILVGAIVFKKAVPPQQIWGVAIGFVGCMVLFAGKLSATGSQILYSCLVLIAALFYALNGQMIRQRLAGIASTDIAALAFAALLLPSGLILLYSGYFSLPILHTPYLHASLAAALLGVLGTAFASIIFYILVKKAGPIFASMVTYGIPFVAIGWGFYFGETIGWVQIMGLLLILAGVYISNFTRNKG